MQRPLVFCLTPTKNEAWILERFLKCASLWADRIIIADQGSTDGTQEIARRFPKVTLVENKSDKYDELSRQRLLLAEARKTEGPKVLLALDADEFLTANFMTSLEWDSIVNAAPGTVISFQWPEIMANLSDLTYFYFPVDLPVGFADDGSEHGGKLIHSIRIPRPPGAPILVPTQIKLMHYCQHDRKRFESKIRWYQCFEYLSTKKKPLQLYRFYNQDLFVPADMIKPVPADWIRGYEENGIEMSSVNREGHYRWDQEVLQYFEEHGTAKFRRLQLWDVDWAKIHHDLCPNGAEKTFPDPRSRLERMTHRWMRMTQSDFCHYSRPRFSHKVAYKCVHRTLRLLGW